MWNRKYLIPLLLSLAMPASISGDAMDIQSNHLVIYYYPLDILTRVPTTQDFVRQNFMARLEFRQDLAQRFHFVERKPSGVQSSGIRIVVDIQDDKSLTTRTLVYRGIEDFGVENWELVKTSLETK